MTAVKWGLVGFGEQAKRMCSALRKLKDVEINAVCCSSENRRREAEQSLEVRAYGKFSEFLANPEIQVVYIATPHHLHTPQAFKAVEAGKHVLVEKPMALSVDGAHKLIDAAKRKNVVLGVNCPLRQHPALQELKQVIQNRLMGELVQLNVYLGRKGLQREGWWRDQFHSGPMCLMDLGVQGIDLLLWLVGERALEVTSLGCGGKDDQTLNVSITVTINFPGGAQGVSSANNLAKSSPGFILVQGTEMQTLAELDWPEGDGSLKLKRSKAGIEEEKNCEPIDLFMAAARNFNSAVIGEAGYSPCGEENYPVVETCCAAIESLKNGKTVRAGEIQRVSGQRF